MESPRIFLGARISGHILIAIFCLLVPEVGPNRFLIAAVTIGVFLPLAILISRWSGPSIYNPIDNYFDMICAVIGAHLTPENWHLVLIVGVVLAQAPVLTAIERSVTRSFIAYSLLLLGFAFAGWYHSVDGWEISVALVAILAPGVVFMSYYQSRKANEDRMRAVAHDSIRLVSGGVAHDFNNILTGVLMNAEFARNKLSDDDPARQSIDKVVEAAERAGSLSQQLLTLSGRGVQQKEPVDIIDEVTSVSALVKTTFTKNIPINVSVNCSAAYIDGDASQIQQVFINLLINAAEASTSESPIEVDISTAGIHKVNISVRDEGSGIPARNQSQIFEPFYSSKRGGRGLGLAAVKRIVDDHEGTITLTSEPDSGCEFVVSFPLIDYQNTETTEAEQSQTELPGFVIVADDDPAILGLLKTVLEENDFQVRTATDGVEFCELYDEYKNQASLVILDLKMPNRSGWACLDHIRSGNPKLPVLIMSGFDPEADEQHREDQNVKFIRKPFRIRAFLTQIDSVLAMKK